MGKFHWLFLISIIILTSVCVIADVGMFLTPWPLNIYVVAFALLLFFPGAILFVVGSIKDRRALKNLLGQSKGLSLLVLALTGAILLYLNFRPRVSTAARFFKDDPIVVTSVRGWPFALSSKEKITEFEYVESFRFGDAQPGSNIKHARMQKEFSRDGFVDRSFAWPINVLHGFLILFGMLTVANWVRILLTTRVRSTVPKSL